MNTYFSPDYTGVPFRIFGKTHMAALTIFIIINFLVLYSLKKLNSKRTNSFFRFSFGAFIAIFDIASMVWFFYSGNFSLSYSLPLHICDVAVIISVAVLFSRNYFLFEILYFWGWAGTLQAIITPDLYPYDFPHFVFMYYFFLHCSIITTILYMAVVEKYRPTLKSIGRTLMVTNIYAVIIAVVNKAVDGNYMYLCSKPASATIMDYLGPWPWYLIQLELLAVLFFIFYYAPYAIKDYTRHKSKGEHVEPFL